MRDLLGRNIATPEAALHYECKKIMDAGIWLIRNGYGRLMLLPYIGGPGCWRLELHAEGNTNLTWFRYSAANGADYLGNHCKWKLRRNVKVEYLARAILSFVPDDLKSLCAGPVSAETERWLMLLEQSLKRGLLPVAIEDYKTDDTVWHTTSLLGKPTHHLHPQPGYIAPGNEQKLVQTDSILRDGLQAFSDQIGDRKPLELDRQMLEDDSLYDLAKRLRVATRYTPSDFEMLDVLKAIIGKVLIKT